MGNSVLGKIFVFLWTESGKKSFYIFIEKVVELGDEKINKHKKLQNIYIFLFGHAHETVDPKFWAHKGENPPNDPQSLISSLLC